MAVLSPALGDGGARGAALREGLDDDHATAATGAWRTMRWRGAGGQVYIVMLRRRIDRGLAGGAADEPIFGCFAVMINESDWTAHRFTLRRRLWSAQVYAVELSTR